MTDTGPTKTLAEWMEYEKSEEAKAAEPAEGSEPTGPISDEQAKKFVTHYGAGADQKMDRATLDARLKALEDMPDPEPTAAAPAPTA
jgi:hypothetical protein